MKNEPPIFKNLDLVTWCVENNLHSFGINIDKLWQHISKKRKEYLCIS